MFCAFVDFKKAFDFVNRDIIWYKLIKLGVRGKMLNIIRSMYNSVKLELMFMKHYAPNRCLYIKVAKLRTGVGSAEMSHLQNRCLKISG